MAESEYGTGSNLNDRGSLFRYLCRGKKQVRQIFPCKQYAKDKQKIRTKRKIRIKEHTKRLTPCYGTIFIERLRKEKFFCCSIIKVHSPVTSSLSI
jgi:hypothetical protein